MRKRVEQAWRLRWLSLLECGAAGAFAASLLELRSSAGPLFFHTKWTSWVQGLPSDEHAAVVRVGTILIFVTG